MKKENGISLIYIIIIVVALISILVSTILILNSKFKNGSSRTTEFATDISTVANKESKIEKLSEEDKYAKIAEQCGEKLVENVSTVIGYEIEYVARINPEDIEYTNKYSSNGDYYYLMTASLNINAFYKHAYLIRCQWNDKTNQIENYGDNSALLETLSFLDNHFGNKYASLSFFLAKPEYYLNDDIWAPPNGCIKDDSCTLLIDKLKNLKEIDIIIIATKENTEYFQSHSKEIFNEIINENKKLLLAYSENNLLPIAKINYYVCIIPTPDEFATSVELLDYMPNTITINSEHVNNLLNRLKQESLFYQEEIFLSE